MAMTKIKVGVTDGLPSDDSTNSVGVLEDRAAARAFIRLNDVV